MEAHCLQRLHCWGGGPRTLRGLRAHVWPGPRGAGRRRWRASRGAARHCRPPPPWRPGPPMRRGWGCRRRCCLLARPLLQSVRGERADWRPVARAQALAAAGAGSGLASAAPASAARELVPPLWPPARPAQRWRMLGRQRRLRPASGGTKTSLAGEVPHSLARPAPSLQVRSPIHFSCDTTPPPKKQTPTHPKPTR